jgi:hypothetical protein
MEQELVNSGFSTTSNVVNKTQPEIVNYIQNLPFEIEVTSRAIDIYYRLAISKNTFCKVKAVKITRKLRCAFYCVFTSFKELGTPIDPVYLADIISLPRNNIEKAFRDYSPPGFNYIDPESMLSFYIMQINKHLEDSGLSFNIQNTISEIAEVIKVCKSTKEGAFWVRNNTSKIIAIVAIYFYIVDLKGIFIDKLLSIIEQCCYVSWSSIKKYYDKMVKYYNDQTPA